MKKQYEKAKLDIFPLRRTDVIACSNYDTNQSCVRGYSGVTFSGTNNAEEEGYEIIW